MNKKISISLAITIAIIAMTVTFSVTMVLAGQRFNNTVSSVKEKENMYSKLAEIDKYVRDNAYYEINDDTLNDTIASGYMLGTGDRAAVYYTANAYAELQDIADGKLMGIGVDVVKDASGAARIIRVYDDSPAAEAGLEKGGYITAIDGTDVKGLTRDNVTSRLRGETGTTVTVTYLSPASEEYEQLVAQRDAGKAVLLVSFELDEIMSLSDRIDVIYDGRIVSEVAGKDADENELGLMMAGGKQNG